MEEILRESTERSNELQRALAMNTLARLAQQQALTPDQAAQIEATYELVNRGITSLGAGNAQYAIDEYFDPLLGAFEEMIREQSLPTYVARSDKEGMYYILTEASRNVQAQAVGSYGANVYYWKALALEQLGDREGAANAIARALELSPANSWFLSYRADSQRLDHDWSGALADYEAAAEFARLLTPEAERDAELGFALRGRAYVLFELGRLDDAATQYEECLELDPDDLEAAAELAYIREVMRRRNR